MFSGVILDIVYGLRPGNEIHEFIDLAKKGVDMFNQTRTKGFWIDYFPWLTYAPSWLPGPLFNALKFTRKYAGTVTDIRRREFDMVTERFVRGAVMFMIQ